MISVPYRIASTRGRGFTLIEMLVSTAVLLMLFTAVTSLVNLSSGITTNELRRLDADAQARLVFDRIAVDLARMVKRPDVDYLFRSAPGNDQVAFYSESTGYYPTGLSDQEKGTVSLVGYAVSTTSTGQPQLLRLSKGLSWSGVQSPQNPPMIFGTGNAPGAVLTATWPRILSGDDQDYQVLSEAVYRFEVNFLLKPFTNSAGVRQPAILSVTPWDTRQAHTAPDGMKDVSAVVVAIGILDSRSRTIVPSDQYSQMIQALPDASVTSIIDAWSKSQYFLQNNIPRTAASQLRVYQRTFPLHSASPL